MADDFHKVNVITVDSENPSRHHYDRRREIKQANNDGVDLISCLPDEILHRILSFIETKFAIRTSVLSRRWRHICWGIPSLYFDYGTSISTTDLINKTLIRYTAGKIISFYLRISQINNAAEIDRWIEFAMSRKVENLSLRFHFEGSLRWNFPDIFYSTSSLKQLSLDLRYYDMMNPRCTVSWTSLKNLSLGYCSNLPDELAAQILSGCPVLESLTLVSCHKLGFLDLSKSLLLRRLDITCTFWDRRSTVIKAPHIHYLRLRNCMDHPSTLVAVSSLTEAHLSFWHIAYCRTLTTLVCFPNMLAKLHNVKKLTLEASFLQVLSYAEHSGVTFPTFKVETLTLEINIFRSVLTGLTKMLQNSHELKKITVQIKKFTTRVRTCRLFDHLDSKGLNKYQLWRVKDGVFQTPMDTIPTLMDMEAEAKFVFWLVEYLLRNTKTVKTIVLLLGSQVSEKGFNKLVRMVPTLNNKVSIILKRSND